MARRSWTFTLESGRHTVELHHRYFLGTRRLRIDGVETVQRGSPFGDHSGEHPIPLPGHDAFVRISTNGLTYSYALIVDGRDVSSGAPAGAPGRPWPGRPGAQRASAALIALIGAPLVWLAATNGHEEYRYRTDAAEAVATAAGKQVLSGRSTSYRIQYRFEAGGRTFEGRDTTSRSGYERTIVDVSRYRVIYVRSDPTLNRFAGNDGVPLVALLGALAAGTIGLAGSALIRAQRALDIARRIAERGQPVSGTVTRVKRQSLRGLGAVRTVEFVYDDPSGRRRRGRSPMLYPSEGDRYAVGDRVRVLIDPDRPGDSLWT